jgi:hypothetical protein
VYTKVLIPLNGSKEVQGIFPHLKEVIAPYSEVILLQVISPGKEQLVNEPALSDIQQEEISRFEAINYLHDLVNQYGEGSEQWCCRVIIDASVPDAIAEFAVGEEVDLIGLYGQEGNGLVTLVEDSLLSNRYDKGIIEIKAFDPPELATAN